MSTLPNPTELRKQREHALRIAAFNGNVKAIQHLIQLKVDVNATGVQTRQAALHYAVIGAHKTGKGTEYLTCIQLLLSAGADPTRTNLDGKSVLALATEAGQEEIIETIRKHRAESSNQDVSLSTLAESLTNPVKNWPIPTQTILKDLETLLNEFNQTEHPLQNLLQKHDYLVARQVTTSLKMLPLSSSKQYNQIVPTINSDAIQSIFEPLKHFKGLQKLFLIKFLSFKDGDLRDLLFDIVIYIAECISWDRNIESRKNVSKKSFKDFFETFIDNKQTKIIQEQHALIDNIVLKMSNKIEILLTKLKVLLNQFYPPTQIPNMDLVTFINQYFKEDKLDKLALYSSYMKTIGIPKGKDLNEENLSKFVAFINEPPSCWDEIHLYYKEYIERLGTLFKSLREHASICTNFGVDKPSDAETTLAHLLNMFGSRMVEDLKNYKEFPPVILVKEFFTKQRASEWMINVFTSIFKIGSQKIEQQFQKTAQIKTVNLWEHFKAEQEKLDKIVDFENAKANEKRTQKLNEQAKREARREEAQVRFSIQSDQERKLKIEKQKIQKQTEMISKIFSQIPQNHPMILILKGILDGNTKMKNKEFMEVLGLLPFKTNESDFGVTATLETFGSINAHFRHNRDEADMIDPAAVAKLKEILENVGLSKANFWEKVKLHSPKSKLEFSKKP